MNTMGRSLAGIVLFLAWCACAYSAPRADESGDLEISGLSEPVEIIRDRWGVSHIYARNQRDLFFAQGFNVARDRLFQLELWRRRATGTTAEIIGPAGVERDIGARLLKARVNMKEELSHYHPQGEEIVNAFVAGINAYISLTRRNPDLLPLEFSLLGIKPQHWTPDVVVSRHNGLSRNVTGEVALARAVHAMGSKAVEELLDLHPGQPHLEVPKGLDLSLITNSVLDRYRAFRRGIQFKPEHIVDEEQRAPGKAARRPAPMSESERREALGSNNWVVDGSRTLSGRPIMANDPHRSQQIPSLRYWVHLSAPGWNVIGGGEPALPGVSIGHNEHGAWGLTIFGVDQEDLYVYDTNPDNPNQYRYKDHWESMNVIRESIAVKGQPPVEVELKYTRHGPVLHEDAEHHKAYALRAAWLEVGCAPYLASLRFGQATTWEEFREACSFHRVPSENMVWADTKGNIGWQAVAIAPRRQGWNGLLPVPGDGRFEWGGFIPILELPHVFNPPQGYFASANEDNVPEGYPHALGFAWASPYRVKRIREVLESGRKAVMLDMMRLQNDEVSLPARSLTPLLKGLRSEDAATQRALALLLAWDHVLGKDSIEAAIYTAWQRDLVAQVKALYVPEKFRAIAPTPALTKVISWITNPDAHFGENPIASRDALLVNALEQAVKSLEELLGPDMAQWQYGQEKIHYITIRHTLSRAVNEPLRAKLDIGPLPRGGDGTTVNNTRGNTNQRSGPSLRIIADTNAWDNSLGVNNPGQSGNPDSAHYADLFEMWAGGKYFPLFFTREKVDSVAESTLVLTPVS